MKTKFAGVRKAALKVSVKWAYYQAEGGCAGGLRPGQ
jgi:hypothetical protein